jgi:predicted neuraminidase
MNKVLRWWWLPLTLVAGAWAYHPLKAPALPPLPSSDVVRMAKPYSAETLLPAPTKAVHSSTLIDVDGGDRLMFWFGGSREGATDVAIWQSRWHRGVWSEPRAIMNPARAGADEWRYIKKVGNPLAVKLANGDIQLFFVSVSLGGWAGSSLNVTRSSDQGKTWSTAHKVGTSPFLNISTLARTHATPLADGGFYLPVYHEFIRKFPELLRFDANGELVDKVRMSAQHQLLQPAMVQVGRHRLLSFLRDGRGQAIHKQESFDAGQSWTSPEPIELINRDSSATVTRLRDGRLLAIANDGQKMREQLALFVSHDGEEWQHKGWLEYRPGSGEEYSYPSVHVDGDTIDVSYTWQRKNIKHVRFNLAWLDDAGRLKP